MRQRHALARGRKKTNILNRLFGIAIWLLIAHGQVVDGLSLQDLADRITADGSLDGVLYIRHIDAETRRRLAVNSDVEIGLARIALESQILDPGNLGHHLLDLFALFLEDVQVRPVKLGSESAFRAGKRLIHVVFNGLREIPEGPGIFLELAIHRGDQLLFILMKDGPPLVLGLQVDEIFRVAESSGVGSIVGSPGLRDDRGDFGERGEDIAGLRGEARPFRVTGAVRQLAAGPNGAFVQMGQELRADDSAESQKQRDGQRSQAHADGHPAILDRPPHRVPIPLRQKRHHRVAPFLDAIAE